MPVYNEQGAIEDVVNEWLPVLQKECPDFQFLILNDGSTDQTLKILNALAAKSNQVTIISHNNQGHGQSCLRGYEHALALDYEWVFQIDSDGQCDPVYFAKLWTERHKSSALFGSRWWRQDGIIRWMSSWVVSACVFTSTGYWLRDPNVPYRLVRTDLLKDILPKINKEFYLANIALSVLIASKTSIFWTPIVFRKRIAGQPKLRLWQFAKHGARLYQQLRQLNLKG